MTIDITPIVEALIVLMGAVITCIVVPYIRSKTTVEERKEVNEWVKIAVSAAEQIYKGFGRGAEKKEYVLKWLENRGITYDADTIDALIESAVYDLTNGLIVGETVNIVEKDVY